VVDVDKDLVEVYDQVMEASPVIEEVITGANRAGASQAGSTNRKKQYENYNHPPPQQN
jgi:hypothetical protein